MLIINNQWVTNKCAKHIQEAVMKKKHINFFLEK